MRGRAEINFARRMRMRREGTRPCGRCDQLRKPDDLDGTGTCSSCITARLERIEAERIEAERQAEQKRKNEERQAEQKRKNEEASAYLHYVQHLRERSIEELDREEMLGLGVADGVFSQAQSNDIMRDVERYSDVRIREMLSKHYAALKEMAMANEDRLKKRIAMSTPNRTGKTRAVLSEALQRASDVVIVVADQAMKDHYEVQIQALIPHAAKNLDGSWQVGVGSFRFSIAGRGALPRGEVVVDPSIAVNPGEAYYAINTNGRRG